MLAIVCLSTEAFSQPASLSKLAKLVREYELVLVCPHHAATPGNLSALRTIFGGHVVIAVLVDGVVRPREREVIEGIVNDGNVPLIVSTRDPASTGVTDWLYADTVLSLPDDVHGPVRSGVALNR